MRWLSDNPIIPVQIKKANGADSSFYLCEQKQWCCWCGISKDTNQASESLINEVIILASIVDRCRQLSKETLSELLEFWICFIDILFKCCCRCVRAAFPSPSGSRQPKSTHQQLWGSYLDQKWFDQIDNWRDREDEAAGFHSDLRKEARCILKADYQKFGMASVFQQWSAMSILRARRIVLHLQRRDLKLLTSSENHHHN